MNFEQLLDAATKGPWNWLCHEDGNEFALVGNQGQLDVLLATDVSEERIGIQVSQTDSAYIARCNPAVMREVWAALKEVAEPSNWFFDEGAHQMVCRKDVRTRCTRALALLDGQTEKGGAE